MLRLPRSAARLVIAVAACSATASAAPPVLSEVDECIRLRKAAKPREAIPHCRVAYDALPPSTADEALHDRSLVVWQTHYTYKDAHAAARDPALMCEEAAFLRAYLDFLDTHVSVDTRPADRRDATRLVKELDAALGDHRCETKEDELLPVRAADVRPAKPPPPPPARVARPLRISGGVGVGVGLLLASATAVPLALGDAVERQHNLLVHEAYPMGQVPGDIRDADAQLGAQGVRLNQIAAGIAAVAGALLISGITMLAVDGHRHRRAQSFASHPRVQLAGLRFALEF